MGLRVRRVVRARRRIDPGIGAGSVKVALRIAHQDFGELGLLLAGGRPSGCSSHAQNARPNLDSRSSPEAKGARCVY